MGYTHYWEGTPTVSEECVKHIKRIVGDGKRKGIIAFESDSEKPPFVASEQVRFNGIGSDAHETFHVVFGSNQFDFCKTAQKPYDVYVVAVLSAIEYHTDGAFKWTSDGERFDHFEGIALMMKKL